MAQPNIILHHYPRSPFAEKVRVAFGLKGLTWYAVTQPRIAPKPALTALTGGYRRIPVMQVGADIYCDTRCILQELERRFPQPTLYPAATKGLADAIAAWADRSLFANALGLVFGLHGERFPPELHADRARFTAGRFDGWDSARMKAKLPELRMQFAIQLRWLEQMLHGHGFLLGDAPSLADVAVFHPLWYALGNLENIALAQHPRLAAWMDRIVAIGHGQRHELTPDDALAIARDAVPIGAPMDSNDALPYAPGTPLTVVPSDWGFDPVDGELAGIGHDSIALRRNDSTVGATVVHFPLDGFSIRPAGCNRE